MHNHHMMKEIKEAGEGCPACDARHVRRTMNFGCSCDMNGGCPAGCQQCMVCFDRKPEQQEQDN